MNPFSKKLLLAGAALLLTPLTASALPEDCDTACEPTTPCWVRCALPWNTTIVTCGVWVEEYSVGTCGETLTAPSEEPRASVEPQVPVCAEPMTRVSAATP
ncbi:hypothetical protein LZ198_27630 [Myxococcus sp. K15C18031901]|uniref:hypothetical protein n=1 Tax=Myxococcus dinghuensis TaxID=2906761 RepID=UPI0020A7B90C|nr:hypothetical protein [Myxococcus dinghuensis]MCP3102652.1 hypothetical protein [Myxococcus dinghuensis]